MSTTGALRGFWASVRPRTWRGALAAAALVVAGAAVLAVLFVYLVAQAWSPYLETALHPDANARSWAALAPEYAGATTCTACHEPQAAKAASARHASISCESCHGPLETHVVSAQAEETGAAIEAGAGGPAADAGITLATPTDAVCVRCHAAAVGRPIAFRQVVPSEHYVTACLDCHDPHTGISRRPPVVVHPLANLPPCLTCHGPEGFKARNQRHPAESGDDASCLACHASDRGRTWRGGQ